MDLAASEQIFFCIGEQVWEQRMPGSSTRAINIWMMLMTQGPKTMRRQDDDY